MRKLANSRFGSLIFRGFFRSLLFMLRGMVLCLSFYVEESAFGPVFFILTESLELVSHLAEEDRDGCLALFVIATRFEWVFEKKIYISYFSTKTMLWSQ